MRLDIHLAEALKLPRNRVQFFIEQGLVRVNGILAKKAGQDISPEKDLILVEEDRRTAFVARSAVKLDRYLAANPDIHITGKVCLDVGSSTGGFVQVLLAAWAREVTALDVGTAQLHESLRSDSRIISLENTDFRDYSRKNKTFDIITADVSFISLVKLLPAFARAASSQTELILLFKPQFEVGPENLTKNNLPKTQAIIHQAMRNFRQSCKEHGFIELDCRESELPGEAWNREWVFHLKR